MLDRRNRLNVPPSGKVVGPSDPTSVGMCWCPLQAKGHQRKTRILVTFVMINQGLLCESLLSE